MVGKLDRGGNCPHLWTYYSWQSGPYGSYPCHWPGTTGHYMDDSSWLSRRRSADTNSPSHSSGRYRVSRGCPSRAYWLCSFYAFPLASRTGFTCPGTGCSSNEQEKIMSIDTSPIPSQQDTSP